MEIRQEVTQYYVQAQDYGMDMALDQELIRISNINLEKGIPIYMDMSIINFNIYFSTMLSHEVTKGLNMTGLPTYMIHVK